MFVGREKELKKMNDMYNSHQFECCIVYGRRRIGKTHLIREFVKDKPTIFFQATNFTFQENLNQLKKAIDDYLKRPSEGIYYTDIRRVFDDIVEIGKKENIVFVIDEYPYLAEVLPEVSSILQYYIDHLFKELNITLILCGSSLSFMEKQVLGYKSPLYGRRTAQIRLKAFTIWEAKEMLTSYEEEELFQAYSITGGIPYYISLIDSKKSLKENISSLFLRDNGYLYQEAQNLLLQEFREPARYNSILQAIAYGATKRHEISTKTNIEYSQLGTYLNNLLSVDIIERETPLFQKEGRKSIYKIKDGFFHFWYRFIPKYSNDIVYGREEYVWKEIQEEMNHWLGWAFESLAKEWCQKQWESLPVQFQEIGRWWGGNPRTKQQEEIDLVAVRENKGIFIECKYRNTINYEKIKEELIRKSQLFDFISEKHYIIFSKGKPTEKMEGITIISLREMI